MQRNTAGVYKHHLSVVINKLSQLARGSGGRRRPRPHRHTVTVAWCEGEVCVHTNTLQIEQQVYDPMFDSEKEQ